MELLLDLIPMCGSVLSATATFVKSTLVKHAKMVEQWEQLQVDLPKLSKELERVALTKPDLVHDLQGVVNELKTFLSAHSLPRKRDTLLSIFRKQGSDTEFSALLGKLEAQIKATLLLISFKTFVEMGVTRDQLAELNIKHNLSLDKLNGIQDGVTRIEDKLDRALNGNGHDNGSMWVRREVIRSALAVLENAGGHSDNEKNDAKKTLLDWLEGPTGQQDALKVALIFARDGSDDIKSVGLDILNQMSEDPEQRKRLFASSEALEVLLAVPRGEATDAVTQRASQCLTNLVTEEPATFFDKWEKMDDSRRAIVDDGLMRHIVDKVIGSIDRLQPKEEKSENQALRVLAKLAEIVVCKPVVARAGGIAALAKVYTATEDMTTAKTEATVSSLVLLAIDALASLATDATCRATFAEEDGASIRPLVHFLWSCAALSTEDHQYLEWVVQAHNDGEEEERYGPLLTPFGRHRVTEKIWKRENAALKALCALLVDAHCRDVVMKLGTFIDIKSGEISLDPHSRTNSSDCGHTLAGWVAFANQVAKGMKDIETAKPWDGTETPQGIRTVGSRTCWPSDRVAPSPDLVRAVWNLVDVNGTKFGLLAVKNLMKGGSRASVLGFFLFCGQFEVLDYDELLDYSVAVKSTRAIKWAKEYEGLDTVDGEKNTAENFWGACVLMSALTPTSPSPTNPSERRVRKKLVRLSLEMNKRLLWGDEDATEPYLPLVEQWVIKTRRDDMDRKCIPLLGEGARRLTSSADDSEDEDDDSSSEGDRSGDDRSDSDDGDDSDISKHSGSSWQRADDVDDSDTSKHSESSQESADDVVLDARQECVDRLADLWPDFEDTIWKECTANVVHEVRELLPADATAEEVVPDDAIRTKDEIRRKDNGDGSVRNLKKLVAEQVGTLPEKIRIQIGGTGTAVGDDDSPLEENEVLARTKLASDAGE